MSNKDEWFDDASNNSNQHNNNPGGVESAGENPRLEITWMETDSRAPGKNNSLSVNEFAHMVVEHAILSTKQQTGMEVTKRNILNKLLMNNVEKLAKRLEEGKPFGDLV